MKRLMLIAALLGSGYLAHADDATPAPATPSTQANPVAAKKAAKLGKKASDRRARKEGKVAKDQKAQKDSSAGKQQ